MANPIEIANAYVALRVKMPGVTQDVSKALGGAAGAGDSAGRHIGDRLVSSASKVLKAGAATLGGVLAAGVGTAMVKGFQRLDAIDTARRKLTGLGNDAGAVDEIMKNALASVKGTAFGLGDAATVAAQAVAAGIKPGKDLEKVLGTVANTAAAAGVDLGEMGSIFSKAMSQANGIQNDVIGQLADKGIPIYQALGDQLGVTAGEVFKLASEGKINFDQFAAAATAASGTVAKEMGGTVGGSFKNLLASLGRIGAGLMGGVFPLIAPSIQKITAVLGPFEAKAGELGAKIGEKLAPALDWFAGILKNGIDAGPLIRLWQAFSPLSILFKALEPLLPQVMGTLKMIAGTVGGALQNAFAVLLPPLLEVVRSLSGPLSTAVATVLPVVLQLARVVGMTFSTALTTLAPVLAEIVSVLGGEMVRVALALLPMIEQLASVFAEALSSVRPLISALLPLLAGILAAVGPIVVGIVDFVAANQELVIGLGLVAGAIAATVGAVSLFKGVQLGLTAVTYGSQGAMVVAGVSAKVYGAAMAVLGAKTTATTLATKASSIATTVWSGVQKAAALASVGLSKALEAAKIGMLFLNPTVMKANVIWGAQIVATKASAAATAVWTGVQKAATAAAWLAKPANLATVATLTAQKVATFAASAATKAAAAAQWVLNAAMKANPIGLIITAVTALVGALVWFFTQTELGKAIWTEFTRFLGEAWTNITGFFTAAWENVIQPVFKKIGEIATWLYENVLKPVFDGIGAVIGWIAGYIKFQFDLWVNAFRFVGAVANWLWVNAIQPAVKAIGDFFGWLWVSAIKPVIDFIVGYFRFLGSIVAWLWTNAVQPAIAAIGAIFTWLWVNVVQPVFKAIGDAATWLWTFGIKPAFDFISGGVKAVGDYFAWLYEKGVKPVWANIQTVMDVAWKWIDKNVFGPIKSGIDLVAKGFEVAKNAIAATWEGIKSAAAVPINFVLGTVWNDGLRSFWNDVVSELGLDDMKLPKAKLVKFASGGVLPGYTPGRDVHEFWSPTGGGLALSGGEAIMRPEFTRAVGGAAGVARLNAQARSGTLAFKDGGVWNDLLNGGADIVKGVGEAMQTAMKFLADPVGMVQSQIIDGIIKPLLGNIGGGVIGKTIGQLPINLMKSLGDLLGSKSASVPGGGGLLGGPALARVQSVLGSFPGLVVTSTYRSPAENASVGGAPGSYHMDAGNPAVDIAGDWSQMNAFAAWARASGGWRELLWQVAGHYDHVHVAAQGGVFGQLPRLYDQGGWLPHGGLAVNQTGRPEAVLTPAESAGLKAGLSGMPSTLVVVDADGVLIGRMEVAADQRIAAALPSGVAVASRFGR